MYFRSRSLRLLMAVCAFAILWMLVPKATFLPVLAESAQNAAKSSHGVVAFVLFSFSLLLQALPTAVFVAVQTAIVYFFSAFRIGLARGLIIIVSCLVGLMAIAGTIVWQFDIASKLGHYPNVMEHFYVLGHYYGPLKMPLSLLLILMFATIGSLVSIRIKDKNILLPVVMFAAYVDFWTVTRGPVSAVMEQAPEVVSAVSTPIPQAGAGVFMPVSMVGPGDFLFLAIVFAAVHKLSMRPARNFWFVLAAMAIGMLAVVFGILRFLPALVVLAIAVVAANWREFKLSRQEKISTTIVAAVLLVSLPVIWSLFSAQTPAPEADTSQSSTSTPAPKPR